MNRLKTEECGLCKGRQCSSDGWPLGTEEEGELLPLPDGLSRQQHCRWAGKAAVATTSPPPIIARMVARGGARWSEPQTNRWDSGQSYRGQ